MGTLQGALKERCKGGCCRKGFGGLPEVVPTTLGLPLCGNTAGALQGVLKGQCRGAERQWRCTVAEGRRERTDSANSASEQAL